MTAAASSLFLLTVDSTYLTPRAGRLLLLLGTAALAASGLFAIVQSASGAFLPHDEAWLGMSAAELARHDGGRIVDFMFHDRVSFGGTLLAIATLYGWLIARPLAGGEPWAWWTIAASAAVGFLSFLSYLGYGYLDTWHGAATLLLLPVFVAGLALTRPSWPARFWPVGVTRPALADPRRPGGMLAGGGRVLVGRSLVVLASLGMVVAGCVILAIGATTVFVPQDLTFIGSTYAELCRIDRGLVPLIAHDRAGFGGGLVSTGVAALGVTLAGTPSRGRWAAMVVAGIAGFGAAIGIHATIGYTDPVHLGPAVLGAFVLAAGLACSAPLPHPRRASLASGAGVGFR